MSPRPRVPIPSGYGVLTVDAPGREPRAHLVALPLDGRRAFTVCQRLHWLTESRTSAGLPDHTAVCLICFRMLLAHGAA
jgi:hypothetical protein